MTVTMDPEEWNRVLAVLSQGPWAQVNPLIMKIAEQMRQTPGAARGLHNDGVMNQARPNGPVEPTLDERTRQ